MTDLEALATGAVVIGVVLVAIGWFAFRADQRRVRVADPYLDPIGDVPPILDLNGARLASRERNIAEAVRTGIPCRPSKVFIAGQVSCRACGLGPCLGVERVIA